jgi:Protein of unknown function (DUF3630)
MSNKKLTSKSDSTSANHNRQPGYLHLNLRANWDNFPTLANTLIACLDATVISRDIGADLYHWTIDFEGTRLSLYYEDNSESCWLELERAQEQDVLDFIATLIESKI